MSQLIIIRGPPASGKTSLAKELVKRISGKKALLTVDEFRWIMTAHEPRDERDFNLSFDNYLYCLKNYLRAGYIVITEDAWVKKFTDQSTDIQKVIKIGAQQGIPVTQILLKGSWPTILKNNSQRPMVIPDKELKELYDRALSIELPGELVIDIDHKPIERIAEEVLAHLP